METEQAVAQNRVPDDCTAVIIDTNVALSIMSTDPGRRITVTEGTAGRLMIPEVAKREIDGVLEHYADWFSTEQFDYKRYAMGREVEYEEHVKRMECIHKSAVEDMTRTSEEWIRLKWTTLIQTGRFPLSGIDGRNMKRAALSVLYDKARNDRMIAGWSIAASEYCNGACLVTDDADIWLFAAEILDASGGMLRVIRAPAII